MCKLMGAEWIEEAVMETQPLAHHEVARSAVLGGARVAKTPGPHRIDMAIAPCRQPILIEFMAN